MNLQKCVLPVQCAKCGATFDLWYDLLARESKSELMLDAVKNSYEDEEHLCWGCRQREGARGEFGDVEESDEDELTLTWE